MLDDINVLKQRDPGNVLAKVDDLYRQVAEQLEVSQAEHDGRELAQIIVAGMGGSALAADMLPPLMGDHLKLPYQVVKGYNLPEYCAENTLVIVSSHSGNTEEALSCFHRAIDRGCQVAVIAAGGKLIDLAKEHGVVYVQMQAGTQPRMAMIMNLRSLLLILKNFDVDTNTVISDMEAAAEWLGRESEAWGRDVPTEHNYAKQLALLSAGKTAVFYGGPLTAPVAYKWKISWNENAKNLSFCNQYPEFNHNEFIGWASHPVEKPFIVFDILSDHEGIRITERMELSDKLLSGMRPKANQIHLAGETLVEQLLWGCILADYVSIYLAILNNVNPEPVELIEKFKKELS